MFLSNTRCTKSRFFSVCSFGHARERNFHFFAFIAIKDVLDNDQNQRKTRLQDKY